MRKTLLGASLLAMAACATAPAPAPVTSASAASETATEAGSVAEDTPASDPIEAAESVYGPDWFVSWGWPGEYPPGFSILEDNVVLMGRAEMDPNLPADIACRMPKLATYQLWNTERMDADALEFVAASRMYEIRMTANAPLEVLTGETGATRLLPLKAGDVLVYKRYIGEGWALISYADTDYEINEAELINVSNIDNSDQPIGSGEDLWVNVACEDFRGTRAWLRYDDVIDANGVGPTPVIGYGDSRDLTPEDLINARLLKEMQQMGAVPES